MQKTLIKTAARRSILIPYGRSRVICLFAGEENVQPRKIQSAANYSQLGLKPFINWLFVGYIAATMSTIRLKL